ncbi:MAG: hypothetical protein ACRD0J_11045 [Acidimicrobiales bacterium]
MVRDDEAAVEQDLISGRLACPWCGKVLGPWGHARWRSLRRVGGVEERRRPRRAKCRSAPCEKTQVLLPETTLIRRRDEVAVIGQAIEARATGQTIAQVALVVLGGKVPMETVRSWLRRFARDAEAIRAHLTRWAHALDPTLGPIKATGQAFSDALEAVGLAGRAAVQRLGPRSIWSAASVMAGGALLCHTSYRFPPAP